jgi:hypothetical protein
MPARKTQRDQRATQLVFEAVEVLIALRRINGSAHCERTRQRPHRFVE